jgi:Na+-transporting methylmalonyl-CoA/oxaloacetate decarboxylase gamma subunit
MIRTPSAGVHAVRTWLTRAVDLVLACAAGLAAAILIARYWRFFYIGTAGGNGMALVFVYLPILIIAAWAVTASIHHLLHTCATPRLLASAKLLALLCFVALALVVEAYRTRDYPMENGEPPSLRAFLASLS